MGHFGCYSLHAIAEDPSVIYQFGNGLLADIATEFEIGLPTIPTAATLQAMIAEIAPHKTLQDNITFAQEFLGKNAFDIATKWLQRSHAMDALHGSFCDTTVAAPQQVDSVVFSGGMANWMLRRMMLTLRLNPQNVGRILLPMGTRTLGAGEHQMVNTYKREHGEFPTEAQFADRFIVETIAGLGFVTIELIPADTANGTDVLANLFEVHPNLLEAGHKTLIVGNAPNTVQAAAQFRLAAREVDKSYDYNGSQLFMLGDTFPIGINGQPTWQAQNPLSGIGQILRLYKVLLDNVEFAA